MRHLALCMFAAPFLALAEPAEAQLCSGLRANDRTANWLSPNLGRGQKLTTVTQGRWGRNTGTGFANLCCPRERIPGRGNLPNTGRLVHLVHPDVDSTGFRTQYHYWRSVDGGNCWDIRHFNLYQFDQFEHSDPGGVEIACANHNVAVAFGARGSSRGTVDIPMLFVSGTAGLDWARVNVSATGINDVDEISVTAHGPYVLMLYEADTATEAREHIYATVVEVGENNGKTTTKIVSGPKRLDDAGLFDCDFTDCDGNDGVFTATYLKNTNNNDNTNNVYLAVTQNNGKNWDTVKLTNNTAANPSKWSPRKPLTKIACTEQQGNRVTHLGVAMQDPRDGADKDYIAIGQYMVRNFKVKESDFSFYDPMNALPDKNDVDGMRFECVVVDNKVTWAFASLHDQGTGNNTQNRAIFTAGTEADFANKRNKLVFPRSTERAWLGDLSPVTQVPKLPAIIGGVWQFGAGNKQAVFTAHRVNADQSVTELRNERITTRPDADAGKLAVTARGNLVATMHHSGTGTSSDLNNNIWAFPLQEQVMSINLAGTPWLGTLNHLQPNSTVVLLPFVNFNPNGFPLFGDYQPFSATDPLFQAGLTIAPLLFAKADSNGTATYRFNPTPGLPEFYAKPMITILGFGRLFSFDVTAIKPN